MLVWICSPLEQLCRTLASWLGAVGTVQNMSKGLPLFAFEMISIQILVATDRHLNPEFWLLHCGASLVGVILTSRLAQRGWSIAPRHARLDRSLFPGTCTCSADPFCGAIFGLAVQYIGIFFTTVTRPFWLCEFNLIKGIFKHMLRGHLCTMRYARSLQSFQAEPAHFFSSRFYVPGAPFCLWEPHTSFHERVVSSFFQKFWNEWSKPKNEICWGVNSRLPAILVFTRVPGFWPITIWL